MSCWNRTNSFVKKNVEQGVSRIPNIRKIAVKCFYSSYLSTSSKDTSRYQSSTHDWLFISLNWCAGVSRYYLATKTVIAAERATSFESAARILVILPAVLSSCVVTFSSYRSRFGRPRSSGFAARLEKWLSHDVLALLFVTFVNISNLP